MDQAGPPEGPRSRRKCTARKKKGGGRCSNWALRGATVCRTHLINPKARAKAAVRAELEDWGITEATEDPGEVLLRLVTQSARRANHYATLLQQAYEAAERVQTELEAERLLIAEEKRGADDDNLERPELQAARADLERIFTTGGVAALIKGTYATTAAGRVFQTGEAISGLAELEAKERDRCAAFAAKAVAAGLKEREVRIAERQGALLEQVLTAVLGDLGLTDDQLDAVPDLIERHLAVVAG